MGTRHITIVRKDKKNRVAQYGQWDGYLSGQGIDIINILKELDINKFKTQVDKCKFITNEESNKLWETDQKEFISRDTGGKILNLIYNSELDSIPLLNNFDFIFDSLFCEYGYLVDLDSLELIIFEGYNKEPLKENDLYFFEGYCKDGYYPIKEIKRFKLNNLDEALEFCNKEDE